MGANFNYDGLVQGWNLQIIVSGYLALEVLRSPVNIVRPMLCK